MMTLYGITSGIPLWVPQQNGQQSENTHAERIVKVADDAQGRDGRESGCDEHLRTVRDETLRQAWEGVKDAGRFAAVQSETLGDVAGDGAGSDNGNSVVGRAEVGNAY